MAELWPALALMGLLAAVTLLLALLDWRVGVLVLAFVLPFEGLLPGIGAGAMKLLAAVAVFMLVLHLLRDGVLRARLAANLRSDLSLLLAAFTLLCALSALWAQSVDGALGRALTFAGLFALLHVFGLLEPRWLRRAWGVLLFSAAATVPVGLLWPADGPFAADGRFTSGGLNPNDYAGLLLIVLFVAGIARDGAATTPLRLALAALVLAGILLSGSRTALITLVAAPLLYLWCAPARAGALKVAVVAYGSAAAIVGGLWLLNPSQAQALQQRAGTLAAYHSESTWLGRIAIWDGARDMVRDRPVLGHGAGNFPYVSHRYVGAVAPAALGRPGPVAHNVFLGITAELGVAGLALFGALVWRLLRGARARASQDAFAGALLLGVVAWLLMGLTLSWEYTKIGYVLMGSVLALRAPAAEASA